MSIWKGALASALAATCLLLAGPSSAQFSPPSPATFVGQKDEEAAGVTTALFYPFAQFQISSGGQSVSATGWLLSVEHAFLQSGSPNAFSLNGWYWRDYDKDIDLYSINGKYYFNPNWGVQVGYLASTQVSGNAWPIFLLYSGSASQGTVAGKLQNDQMTGGFDFGIGVGIFIDTTGGRTTSDPTAFLQGSTRIGQGWTLNGSYWYVRDRGDTANRFALGVGYTF